MNLYNEELTYSGRPVPALPQNTSNNIHYSVNCLFSVNSSWPMKVL